MITSKRTLYIGGSLLVIALAFSLGRCSIAQQKPQVQTPTQPDSHAHVNEETSSENTLLPKQVTTYTCAMHPQIQQHEPGDCPICGMDLIPVNSHADDENPRTLTMSKSAMALADIQTSHVEQRYPELQVRLVGKLDYDETRVKSLSARFPARIDRLFVNFNGLKVQKGEHLAQIYSPELIAAASDLLRTNRQNPQSRATRAAREKLRSWDLLPKQIDNLLRNNKTVEAFELLAPMSGVVVQKNINEGDYVTTGQALFKIVDLQHLWLRLEAYEADLAWLRFGQKVNFTVEAFPGDIFSGHISFIEPELNRKTRTVSLRVNVPNEDGRLKPGMFATAKVSAKVAKDGVVYTPELIGKWISPMHPQIIKDGPGQCDICGMDLVPLEKMGITVNRDTEAPLIIPASAALRTGKRAVVYLKTKNTPPTFEGREITLGSRAGDFYVVKSGLAKGDEIVTHGAFKIDSALQIQAKPSMMSPEDKKRLIKKDSTTTPPSLMITRKLGTKLLPLYFNLQSHLADDDLTAAHNTLKDMMSVTGHVGELPDLIHSMLAAESLKQLRRPYFDQLSQAMIRLVEEYPESMSGPVYEMYCPMVYKKRGAPWLQNDKTLRNPYFGSRMLKCGTLKVTHENAKEAPAHVH